MPPRPVNIERLISVMKRQKRNTYLKGELFTIEGFAGQIRKQGINISPKDVARHIAGNMFQAGIGTGNRFIAPPEVKQSYIGWLKERWHGTEEIRKEQQNELLERRRYEKMKRESSETAEVASRKKLIQRPASRQEMAADALRKADWKVKEIIKQIAYDPYAAERQSAKGLNIVNSELKRIDRRLAPATWKMLRETGYSLVKTARKQEKYIARMQAEEEKSRMRAEKRKAREERAKKAHEMKMLMRKKKIEKKAIAEARRRAHEIKVIKKPEETKEMQRFEKRIEAELKKKRLLTLRELAERTHGKRSPSHLFHDFENGAIPGAYYSKYKTRSGKPLVVVPEGNALSYLKKVEAWKRKWVAREKKPKRKSAWKKKSPYVSQNEPDYIKTLRTEQAKAIEMLRDINSKLPLSMLENTDEANMPDHWKRAYAKIEELARKIREAGY